MANLERIRSVVEFIEKKAANLKKSEEKASRRQGKLFFDMQEWYSQFTPEDAEDYREEGLAPPKECGTYMCFAGWAYYKVKGRKAFEANATSRYADEPYFDDEVIPHWARSYFDLTYNQAYDLFENSAALDIQTIEGLKERVNKVLGEKVFDLPAVV